MKKQNIQTDGKSVEEIAREAMEAIKKSNREEEIKEEEEIRIKEQNLKNEVENRIRTKMKKIERELKKEEEEERKKEDVDTSFVVAWTNQNGNGQIYVGEYNDENIFKINRGLNLFHLKVIGKSVICEEWRKNSHTSIDLYTLKSRADKILKESNKAHKILKKKEKKNNN